MTRWRPKATIMLKCPLRTRVLFSINNFYCNLNNVEFLLSHLPNIFLKRFTKGNQEIQRSKWIKKSSYMKYKIPDLRKILNDRKISQDIERSKDHWLETKTDENIQLSKFVKRISTRIVFLMSKTRIRDFFYYWTLHQWKIGTNENKKILGSKLKHNEKIG